MNTIDVEAQKRMIKLNMEDNIDWLDNYQYMDDYTDSERLGRIHYNKMFDIILNRLEPWETNLIILELFSDTKKQSDRAAQLGLQPQTYRSYLAEIRRKIKQLCSD